MARYDTNAAWSDPFDPKPANKRAAERFKFRLKTSIKAEGKPVDSDAPRILVGPGIIRNLSVTGAWLITKHQLVPGQRIVIAIPTKRFAVADYLPAMFIGPAEVVRTKPDIENRVWVGVRFGDSLTQNMEFATFIQGLYALREALTKKD
ncbi:MAG: PilZ domain-containing protein [Candidatus Hydrogenedentes bacterium]|nr:PilZ domain-containing protein [Candidatus Hydrogenedentota bacterium]